MSWLAGVKEEVEEAYEEEVVVEEEVVEEEECGVKHHVAQLLLLPLHPNYQLHFLSSDCL